MISSSRTHAVLRAALEAADEIDPAGRLRLLLHLIRCNGNERLEDMVSLRMEDLANDKAQTVSACPTQAQVQSGASLPPLPGWLELDEEGKGEVVLYLRRRWRHRRVKLFRRRKRGNQFYCRVNCAGGRAYRALGTHDKEEARQKLDQLLPVLSRKARRRASEWLFPMSYRGERHISIGQVRVWVNAAVGRQSTSERRHRCGNDRPAFQSKLRQSRNKV